MNGFPWLTVAGAVPLLGAIVIALIPGLPADSAEADRQARNAMAKVLALGFSLVTLVVVIIIAVKFQVGGPNYQFTEIYSWIPAFGVHYALGVDGIALVLIAMSVVLMPVVILASWNDAESGRQMNEWRGSMTYPFLSAEWMEAAKAIRDKYADQAATITVSVRMNQVITDAPFDFKAGQDLTDMTVTLTDRLTELSGTVRDGRGQAVKDYVLVVFPDDSTRWGGQSRFIRTARPNQDGMYNIKGLPPARYLAVVLESLESGAQNDPAVLEALKARGKSFLLADAETLTLDLSFQP
jgi:hypothetical protein